MAGLTGIERIQNTLKRKPIDRVGVHENFSDSMSLIKEKGLA